MIRLLHRWRPDGCYRGPSTTGKSMQPRDASDATAISPKRMILRDAFRKPGLHFLLDPAHRMCSDFHVRGS